MAKTFTATGSSFEARKLKQLSARAPCSDFGIALFCKTLKVFLFTASGRVGEVRLFTSFFIHGVISSGCLSAQKLTTHAERWVTRYSSLRNNCINPANRLASLPIYPAILRDCF